MPALLVNGRPLLVNSRPLLVSRGSGPEGPPQEGPAQEGPRPEGPAPEADSVEELPGLILQTVVERGVKTAEGSLIQAVTIPWFKIVEFIQRDPAAAFQLGADKWEELIAGAYQLEGWDEVVLTPRSGDFGRDVIATKRGFGIVRIINQVKAYKPGHLVTANDIRALAGVLQFDGASKGFVSTTSDFAPGIKTDPLIVPFMPAKLGLMNGAELFTALGRLATNHWPGLTR